MVDVRIVVRVIPSEAGGLSVPVVNDVHIIDPAPWIRAAVLLPDVL
jgi:hypothetical protein